MLKHTRKQKDKLYIKRGNSFSLRIDGKIKSKEGLIIYSPTGQKLGILFPGETLDYQKLLKREGNYYRKIQEKRVFHIERPGEKTPAISKFKAGSRKTATRKTDKDREEVKRFRGN